MAMVVDALVAQLANTLATLAKDTLVTMAKEEVTMILDAKDDLRRLEKTVQTIRTVLQDAERRAFTDLTVRSWLADLKDVVYDADDVIDYSCTKAEKLAMLSSDQSVRCYSPLFSCFHRVASRHRLGSSIRDINERLQRIIKDQSDFNLMVATGSDHRSNSSNNHHRQTDPLLEPDIVGMGIENDTSYLVGLITEELVGPTIPVLAIVGMGGAGKTTLAQNIYNHKIIEGNFQKPQPIWVCVSQDYSPTNLLKKVIKCAGGDPEGDQSFADLQVLLTKVVEGRKFFLILDDVWDAQVWEKLLRKPLQRGAAGSRVLITTRDERVAKQMGAMHLHMVQPLSIEDGWSLLCKIVFQRNEAGFELFEDIGMQIVKKCGGLPLAIKTIAGVLMGKDRTRWEWEWERVLQNPAWSLTDLPEGVMGVLYLSYEDLPFHLKQCFIFCSLFPEDHVFRRHKLIQRWVAEGFIKEEGDLIMEEVALGYYNDLLRRSLLQPDPQFYDHAACKMHDLLRSLAQFLARDENFVGVVKGLANATSPSSSSSMKLRHLSIVDTELNEVPEVVKEQKSLRTLLLMEIPLMEGVPRDLFEKLGRLRVLDFSWTDIMRLPESVGNLVHLRYLDLTGSSMAELPETVGKLSNLQYLILQSCENLEKLPKSIANLYKLRSLDLISTPVNGLPAGIGRLHQLNRLMGFATNESINGGWCSLEELKSLSRLKSLTIDNLERALIRPKPRGFLLKDKHHMRHLWLYCTPCRADGQRYRDEEARKIQEIFEVELFPPPSLEIFRINGFFGLQFPNWMMTSSAVRLLFNLRRLDLLKCGLCKQLPPLGQLPNLDLLKIKGANAVESIGAEFMGVDDGGDRTPPTSSSTPFPKLETLVLKDMLNLVDWRWEDRVIAMPRLENLSLINCPSLRCLPRSLLYVSTLNTLTIQGANSLATIENLVSIKVLAISGNPNLARISNLPSLQTMTIEGCPVLREVEDLYSLEILEMHDLAMESLPEWLLLEGGERPAFPMLQWLNVKVGEVHVLRRCIVGGPDWPKIQHFANVDIYVNSSSEFVIYNKDPFTFNTNLDPSGGDSSAGAAPNH